jgi:hypothetical protein
VRVGETIEPELLGLEIWGALTWVARAVPEETRLVCLRRADEAVRTDFCLGLDAASAPRVAATLCEAAREDGLAGVTG